MSFSMAFCFRRLLFSMILVTFASLSPHFSELFNLSSSSFSQQAWAQTPSTEQKTKVNKEKSANPTSFDSKNTKSELKADQVKVEQVQAEQVVTTAHKEVKEKPKKKKKVK